MLKSAMRRLWFRPGATRRSIMGPYRGLRFHIGPQIFDSRLIIFAGAYEQSVTDVLRKHIRPGSVVFNIGAHVGIHALYAARLARPGGLVVAYEPWPENSAALKVNVSLNRDRCCSIQTEEKAVGNSQKEVLFAEGHTDGMHHLAKAGEPAKYRTLLTSVDAEVARLSRSPSFLLIDVEGAELDVLAGSTNTVERFHPMILLEYHSPELKLAVSTWLAERRYCVTILDDRHLFAK